MDYDCILKVIGRRSTFFVISLIILSSVTYITSIQRTVLAVTLFQPTYKCKLSKDIFAKKDQHNVSAYVTLDECKFRPFWEKKFRYCPEYKFNKKQMMETFITEYNLICQKKYILTILYYLQLLNIPLIILFGYVADYIGRKNSIILLLIFQMAGHLGIALISQREVLVMLTAFNKISVFTELLGLIWILELSDVEHSEIVVLIYFIPRIIASLSVAIISYLTREWRLVYLLTAIPSLLWFMIMWVPESPRWLLVKNRHKVFVKSVKLIAKMNKVHLSKEFLDEFIEDIVWNGPWRMSMAEFSKFQTLKYRLVMLSVLGLSISVFPTQFKSDINILEPNDISIAYAYKSCIKFIFILPLLVNIFVKKIAKSIMLTFTITIILYVISLFFNRKHYIEFIIAYILTVISENLVNGCKIMLITLSTFLMPTTHRCFGCACILSACIFGDQISTVFKELHSRYNYKTNVNIFVILSCIFGLLLIISFQFLMPKISRGYYPQTSADAETIKIGNEDLIKLLQSEKELSFKKKHTLSQ